MKDVMIDFETMDNKPTAAVVQFGGSYFDRETGELGDQLKINISLLSEIAWGFTVGGETVYWWLSKSDQARKSICETPHLKAIEAFKKINTFLKDAGNIWCHASFDYPILSYHLGKMNMWPTFKFFCVRDLRTMVEATGISYKNRKRSDVAHDALDDCIFQIGYLVECFDKLRRTDAEKIPK